MSADALRRDAVPDAAMPGHVLESLGTAALFGVAAFTQVSIAIAQALLFLAIICWLTLVVMRREHIDVPAFFLPLIAYAAWTLLSAVFSIEPRASLADCKQLVLFLKIGRAHV